MTVPQMPPPGQPPSGTSAGPTPTGPVGFGAPSPAGGGGAGTMDRNRILALVIAAAGLGAFVSAFFALYSVRIAPADWDGVAGIDARSDFPGATADDSVSVHMGFFDAVPFASPIMATVVPAAMILAAVLAGGMALRRSYAQAGPAALAAVVAAVVGLMMMIVTPLPSASLSGTVREEFQAETGMSGLGDLLDTFVPVRPGIGLILAFTFALIGALAAVALYVLPPATARPRPQAPQYPQVPQYPPVPGQGYGAQPGAYGAYGADPQQAPPQQRYPAAAPQAGPQWQMPQQPQAPGYPPQTGGQPAAGSAAAPEQG